MRSARNYESIIRKLRRRLLARKHNRGQGLRDENEGDEDLPWATYTRARRRSQANKSLVLILFAPLFLRRHYHNRPAGLSFIWPPLGGEPVSPAILIRFTVHGTRPLVLRTNSVSTPLFLSTRSTLRAFSISRHLNKSYKYDCARSPSFANGRPTGDGGVRDSRARGGVYTFAVLI